MSRKREPFGAKARNDKDERDQPQRHREHREATEKKGQRERSSQLDKVPISSVWPLCALCVSVVLPLSRFRTFALSCKNAFAGCTEPGEGIPLALDQPFQR